MARVIIALISHLLFLVDLNAQVEQIPYSKDHLSGLNYVYVSINGLTEKFLFDTGASSVCINSSFLNRLKRLGKLGRSDYLYNTTVVGVNNNQINAEVYRADLLKIGGFTMYDVEMIVLPDPGSVLIIGQSIFQRFGKITIDHQSQMILLEKTRASRIQELRFIPCSPGMIGEIPPLQKTLVSFVSISKVSQENNIPPPIKALDRLYPGITIRYFDPALENTAAEIKKHLDNLPDYQLTDIYIENMIPANGSQITGYLEVWVK